MKLGNKVALITGGNSGIGFETAKLFIHEGARVAILGRNPATLAAAGRELGPRALVLKADVTDASQVMKAVSLTVDKFGKLDIVFANAGLASRTPIGKTSFSDFELLIRTNLSSVFFTVQACVRHLNAGASVILNGSVSSLNGRPEYSAYAASKGAIRAMARSMAAELSSLQIRVNVVIPGSSDTPLLRNREPSYERMERSIPLGRVSHPSEVAKAVLFLASEDSSYVQAAELIVDGGATGAPLGAPFYRGA